MKFFYNLTESVIPSDRYMFSRGISCLIVTFSIAFIACSNSSGYVGHDDSSTVGDNVSTDSTSVDGKDSSPTNPDIASWKDGDAALDIGPKYMLAQFQAQTPDDKPATFYICNTTCFENEEPYNIVDTKTILLKVKNTSTFLEQIKVYISGNFMMYAERENYIFVSREWSFSLVNAGQTPLCQTSWGEGEWGLSPNGTYLDSADGKNKTVKTEVVLDKNSKTYKVRVSIAFTEGFVTGNAIKKNDETTVLKAEISDDLSTITYDVTYPKTGNTNKGTLTKI